MLHATVCLLLLSSEHFIIEPFFTFGFCDMRNIEALGSADNACNDLDYSKYQKNLVQQVVYNKMIYFRNMTCVELQLKLLMYKNVNNDDIIRVLIFFVRYSPGQLHQCKQ